MIFNDGLHQKLHQIAFGAIFTTCTKCASGEKAGAMNYDAFQYTIPDLLFHLNP